MHTRMHMHMYAYTCVYGPTYVHKYSCANMCTSMHMHMCMYMYPARVPLPLLCVSFREVSSSLVLRTVIWRSGVGALRQYRFSVSQVHKMYRNTGRNTLQRRWLGARSAELVSQRQWPRCVNDLVL